MILLMIFRVRVVAHRIRSMIRIKSRSYRISAAPKYDCNFSGTPTDPSDR
jgi:hypothetical protein